jgi:antitoxin (DNA-binding transcriptional repressor) of toxin-antitoxin stability system
MLTTMRKVNIHEAKTKLSAILAEVEQNGEHVLICRYNVPVAELSPVKRKKRSVPAAELRDIRFVVPPEEPTEAEWEHA